ncbi:MAG: nucleoside hydrolase [Planctomycetales bacterium]|nr:nucleoside hydrolase [Planctomycetales bacterium]
MIRILLAIATLVFATAALPPTGADEPLPVIFDTDIQGDVDDVGALAVLHALADRGEVKILGMGVSALHPSSAPCLDAFNTFFGRPDVPIGVNKGDGFLRDSKYNEQIAAEFPHNLASANDAPDAAQLYRKLLADADDQSVVIISVGQLSNLSTLLDTPPDQHSELNGSDLVHAKVRAWVCMGGKFPQGKEANFYHHGPAAQHAVEHWPTPIVFSGFEIGHRVMTGAGLKALPETNPVRRAYELFNGAQDHFSWDQTAVLFAARELDAPQGQFWDSEATGSCRIDADGTNRWDAETDRPHTYLVEKAPPAEVATVIEQLMLSGASKK